MSRGEIKNLNQLLRLEEIAFRYDLVNWQVDKELDAVIMVQSVWRSKKEHKKYQAVVGYVENCIWFFACVDSSLVFNGSVRADLILIFFLNLFFPLQLT